MTDVSDVMIALGLVAAFAVVFIGLMLLHKATNKKDMRANAGDGGGDVMISGGDAGSCDGGGASCGGGGCD